MPDTDIDKLRRRFALVQRAVNMAPWIDGVARSTAQSLLDAALAELVGLRTEVDQLRNAFLGDPKCSGCEGGGLVWSGAEYAGTREYVGCPDCEGTGIAPPGLYEAVRSLRTENANLRESAETATFAANRLGEIANVTEERHEDDRLHYDAEANTLRAERDALQARIDALEAEREADGA